ncbi:MAG: hypothetical protein CM1200mP41_08720 [Gammaproteobacteria bacterium]|nr:MAG: hypothetical protein CM1200mP41_08720 [Gammaproteobacteria bacterium]
MVYAVHGQMEESGRVVAAGMRRPKRWLWADAIEVLSWINCLHKKSSIRRARHLRSRYLRCAR